MKLSTRSGRLGWTTAALSEVWHANSTHGAEAESQEYVTMEKRAYIPKLTDNLHQDIDILCLAPCPGDAESIKQRLCEADNRFYTIETGNPDIWWKLLYWHTGSNKPGFKRFKVDILVQGTMGLPHIEPHYIVKFDTFSCAPVDLLLFCKLQAWDGHRRSHRRYALAKVPGDVRDICDILRIANRDGLKVTESKPYISDYFRGISNERVREFNVQYPEYRPLWMGVGLLQVPTVPVFWNQV